MKKVRAALCLLILGLLIPAAIQLRGRLPMDVQPLIEKKYGGWAGTLRLWVCEGWTPGAGSAAGWLNLCAKSFERAHPGVYVQPEYVDEGALRDLGQDGMPLPDMVIFPPGLVNPGAPLLPLTPSERLRPELRAAGNAGEDCLAAPVLMGGCLWAFNAGKLEGIPRSWREAELSPAVPEDVPYCQWSAALLGLCAAHYAEAPETPIPGGLDLGLPAGEPGETPMPEGPGLPCRLPEGFQYNKAAFRDFVNEEVAAALVSQREIVRLKTLDNAPDWRLSGGPVRFTDQLLYLAVVDRDGEGERAALCRGFLTHLLGDACQSELHRVGAFPVTDAPAGYAPGDPMLILDSALRSGELTPAPAFDDGWRADAKALARQFIESDADPAGLWARLAARLRQVAGH